MTTTRRTATTTRTTATTRTTTARTTRAVATGHRPTLLSRHPSHRVLREGTRNLPKFPFRSVIRLGSTTEGIGNTRYAVEINSVESIRRSSSKLLMKQAFARAGVRTAPWFTATSENDLLTRARNLTDNWNTKLVCKHHYGSKGSGNTLVSTEAELITWVRGKSLNYYIFEKFLNFGNEYRLHVTADGCFYTCRKAMRENTPENERWHFHDSTCVWLLETNPRFFKPANWNEIVNDCKRALAQIGADVLSFDVKVQSPASADGSNRVYRDYILLECNSASSLGNPDGSTENLSVCATKYIQELPRLITRKAISQNIDF